MATDINSISSEVLRELQARGALSYLSAHMVLMARELEVPVSKEGLNEMIPNMIEPLNHATEAIWRALMCDKETDKAVERFKESLDKLAEG